MQALEMLEYDMLYGEKKNVYNGHKTRMKQRT
jgi:hypothetical protein